MLGLIAQGRGAALGLTRERFDLFKFTTGDVDNNRRLMDVGLMLPWWTDQQLRVAFFRPISSFTHWLDERLWPGHPALMHAQSLFWFAALLGAVLVLYRRFEQSAGMSGMAFAFYALDDAHAPALAWLANRNALIATCLGCLTMCSHDRWRSRANPCAGVLAALASAAGAAGGRGGGRSARLSGRVCVFLDGAAKPAACSRVAPYLSCSLVWRVAWTRGGFGVHGSGAYIDPLADPLSFLAALPAKLGVLVQGQFSVLAFGHCVPRPPRTSRCSSRSLC